MCFAFVVFDDTNHIFIFFFFNDTATTEIYTLSLHDALPILAAGAQPLPHERDGVHPEDVDAAVGQLGDLPEHRQGDLGVDRKSTRLNSSHANISYAVFCLKKKKKKNKYSIVMQRVI